MCSIPGEESKQQEPLACLPVRKHGWCFPGKRKQLTEVQADAFGQSSFRHSVSIAELEIVNAKIYPAERSIYRLLKGRKPLKDLQAGELEE